ncbi:MAG: TetR/AcrR family transcriptional regulator [Actinomycetota bacterium]
MARPREFDEAEVVDRARNAFWAQGVAATSIADLSDATGLSVGSIYKAFKSKDQLCALTLEDYLQQAQEHLADTLAAAPTPWDGLRAWLEDIIDQAVDTSPTRGCYAVELAAERAAVDDRVRSLLVDHDAVIRDTVAAAVRDAVGAGRVSGDADGVARLICTTINGLQVDARKGLTRPEARATIDTMLGALQTD